MMRLTTASVVAFMKSYPGSIPFQRLRSLINATHDMSSYSLTLQHGVPFQPVNIRVSSDPISLIEKILAQNPGSYAKLQDLINIGTNLVAAGLTLPPEQAISPAELARKTRATERRVTGMAIEAALHEDDFETAYSYVVNRLSISPPSTPAATPPATTPSERATPTLSRTNSSSPPDDGVAWRAALAAGRHKPAAAWAASASPAALLRRLEQRAELLAHALLLAPPAALPEILAVWRRCEEERAAAVARASPDGDEDDDGALEGMPGGFVDRGGGAPLRGEMGRGTAEGAPVGLFDVARGAAGAFSRTALAAGRRPAGVPHDADAPAEAAHGDDADSEGDASRLRKRDMVANAVTGGIASGLGWVLG
jgi:hypothetical protein